MEADNKWFYLRIGVVLLSFISARFVVTPLDPDFLHPAPWYFPFEIAGFLALGMIFVNSFQAFKSPSEKWFRPSWFLNPLDRKQPLVSFDAAACCLISYGLGSAVMGMLSAPANWSWEIPLSGGCGVWLGVRLSMLVYRNQLEQSSVRGS
jgi:hypothetical protein